MEKELEKDSKTGIPEEVANSEFLECQIRNFFNSQFDLPIEVTNQITRLISHDYISEFLLSTTIPSVGKYQATKFRKQLRHSGEISLLDFLEPKDVFLK